VKFSNLQFSKFTPAMHLLLLHGAQQSHETFRRSISPLLRKLAKMGHTISSSTGATNGPIGSDESFRWFDQSCQQLTTVIDKLANCTPKWDGILAFSQGSVVAQLIANHPSRASLFPDLKFAILVATPSVTAPDFPSFPSTPSTQCDLPTLHVVGKSDAVVAPASTLHEASTFSNAEIHQHEGGHHFPMRSDDLKIYLEFIARFVLYLPPLPPPTSLPSSIRKATNFEFDTKIHDLRGEAVKFLSSPELSKIGSFHPDKLDLESFTPRKEIFNNFKARQALYKAVKSNDEFLIAYEKLVVGVVLPKLKELLLGESENGKIEFHFQFPPTLRVQIPSDLRCKTHSDDVYGHQFGEVNFWMPLTDYRKTCTTLWVENENENENEKGDDNFHPLEVDYGEISMFHGTVKKHFVPPNKSNSTRVSLDFRVGVGSHFDPSYIDPSVKEQHGRRRIMV